MYHGRNHGSFASLGEASSRWLWYSELTAICPQLVRACQLNCSHAVIRHNALSDKRDMTKESPKSLQQCGEYIGYSNCHDKPMLCCLATEHKLYRPPPTKSPQDAAPSSLWSSKMGIVRVSPDVPTYLTNTTQERYLLYCAHIAAVYSKG